MALELELTHHYYKIIPDLVERAQKSNIHSKHAACIMQGKQVITMNNNYVDLKKNMSIHAEISALYSQKNLPRNLDMVVIKATKTTIGSSKPCKSCMIALKKMGIYRVFYSIAGGQVLFEYVQDIQTDYQSSGFRWRHNLKNNKFARN